MLTWGCFKWFLLFKLRNTTRGKPKWHISVFLSSQQKQPNYTVYPDPCEGNLIIHSAYITRTRRLPEAALHARKQQQEGKAGTAWAQKKTNQDDGWQLVESWRMKPKTIGGKTRWMTKSEREKNWLENRGALSCHGAQRSEWAPGFNDRFKKQ